MTGCCKGSGCCLLSMMNRWIDDSRSKVGIRNRCMIVLVAAAAAAAAVVHRRLYKVRRMEPTCT
jgi:sigma54-dependent transcription regulator